MVRAKETGTNVIQIVQNKINPYSKQTLNANGNSQF